MINILMTVLKMILALIKFLIKAVDEGNIIKAIKTVANILSAMEKALAPIIKLITGLLS